MSINLKVQKVIDHINTLERLQLDSVESKTYNNMFATIVDTVLQAGMNYNSVVLPRIRVIMKAYPNVRTTSEFIILFQTLSLDEIINWKGVKIDRIKKLAYFLYEQGIENECELAKWLECDSNTGKLMDLDGIGFKSVDYLKSLCGIPSIAIDRHLFKFLQLSGLEIADYIEARMIYSSVAEYFNLDRYSLDKSIWNYMSGIDNKQISFFA